MISFVLKIRLRVAARPPTPSQPIGCELDNSRHGVSHWFVWLMLLVEQAVTTCCTVVSGQVAHSTMCVS
jgi:hypothetical protein